MEELEAELLSENFFQKSVRNYKSNKKLQTISVLVIVMIIALPVYSFFGETEEDDAYQRDNQYIIDGDFGYITWIEQVNHELGDNEELSFTLTEQDFPDEAKNSNIISVELFITVLDYEDDNEETSGAGCIINPGEDELDSVSVTFSTPADGYSFETQSSDYSYIFLMEYPEFETYPFVTGYTIAEIEEMFDTSDEVKGEYFFQFTGNVESGDSTIECDRQDPSVTIQYGVQLEWFEVQVLEWNGGSLL